ncbi:MAG: DNA polymerase I [Gammaproteobacteria bacterium]|nr:DNA polymerase I [Gammaproteobacteria bacterium]MCF6230963.1 DNA polymerase I [Gammaproteobacteria bacterium]
MKKNNPFILVDGSSYLFRAFHAIRDLSNSRGEPTNAVYGVINMIRKLIREYQPELMAVVFDAKGKTFRNDLYPDYKANRPPMPEDLRVQIEPIHNIIRAMGIPLIVVDGVEADDVIGTLCQQASEQQQETLVSTGDKDMAQLINEHVTLINTMTDTLMTPEGVVEKFGIPPEKIIDYLALMGDSADNIPGVPKCGPKTAVKWLNQFGSFDEVLAQADKVKGKVGENLRASLKFLPLSYELATIKLDVALTSSPEQLTLQPPDYETLIALFNELEFKNWLGEAINHSKNDNHLTPKNEATDNAPNESHYEIILEQPQLDSWLKKLNQAELFAFDCETTSLDYMEATVVGVSFAVEANHAAYLPLAHRYLDAPPQLDKANVLAQLKPLLEDNNHAKVGQNLKYDMSVLANEGITLRGIRFDTMLESYTLNSIASRHDMDTLALKHLSHNTLHFEEIAGKGKNQLTFDQIDIDTAGPYAAEDADITLRLHQALWPQLRQLEGPKKIFETIEIPLVSVLSRIERNGVLIDAKMLHKQSLALAERILTLEKESFQVAGEAFNMNSPKQLQTILFEKLGLPVISKTPKGQPSTAESVLVELAEQGHQLPQLITEHRSLSKLKSTYTDKLPQQINQRSGRVHTSYHQAVTSTGRLSSSSPNLQNIPVRSEQGRHIRQAFIAPAGFKLLAADYSQIELRIMAHLSNDQGLLDAFTHDMDVHSATAAEVFGIELNDVSKEQRRRAKAINFGLIYGMSAFGLAKQLDISRTQAQQYVELYFERYPGVKRYMDEIKEHARQQGYVETVLGRRLYLPEINARNGQRRQYAERTAINAPMQGTAADIIKLAMIQCDQWLQQNPHLGRMTMQVHDELVFEVRNQHLTEAKTKIIELMSSVVKLKVPLKIEAEAGDNWEQAH